MQSANAKVLSLNFMGCLWGYIGMNLIRKGLPTLVLKTGMSWAIVIALLACVIGFFKAKFVLRKTANRLISRLDRVTSYTTIFKFLDLKFIILIIAMMGFGISLSMMSGFEGPRSFIRIVVGYGLLQGSFYFFKPAFTYGIRG
jgi:hypothetical protein